MMGSTIAEWKACEVCRRRLTETARLEELLEGCDRSLRPRGDAERRRIERGDRQLRRQQRAQFLLGQPDRQHGAAGQLLHEAAAQHDQRQRVFEGHDSRQHRGDEFADAVSDHGARLDAETHPQLRQRVLDGEDGRLGHRGRGQPPRRLRRVRVGVDEGAQVRAERRGAQFGAAVEMAAEHPVLRVQIARHVRVLRALAGKHEGDAGIGAARAATLCGGTGRGQLPCSVGAIGGDDEAAVREGAPAELQRAGHIGERRVGRAGQAGSEVGARRRQCRRGARRDHQQLRGGRCGRARRRGRRLLEHHVHVGAADAEGTDAGAARRRTARPVLAPGIDVEGGGGEVDLRIGALVVQRGGQHAALERQGGLDEPDHTGGGIQVPDVGLHRAERTGAELRAAAKALLSAATSIGSPSGVAVPWHST